MEIDDGPVLRLTAPESRLIDKSFIGVRSPAALLLKHRLDAATTLWAQEKLGWPIERAISSQKGILHGLAQAAWTEADGEAIELQLYDGDLKRIHDEVAQNVDIDYQSAMRTPKAVFEDVIFDIMYGDTDELIKEMGGVPLTGNDREHLEANEFTDRLHDIALGRYILETIDKHLSSQD